MSGAPVDRYLKRRDRGRRKDVVTPEGVILGFTLAQVGARAGAFLLDMLIIHGSIIVVGLLWYMALGAGSEPIWLLPLFIIAVFILQNFYFIYFELRWKGQTPGKRAAGIRVIDAHGGPLTAGAVIARNLVRDVEVFVPLQILLIPDAVAPGAPGLAMLLASLWALVLAFLPLFNKDRLRAGDMVGGTLVVLAPRALLLPDIGGEEATRAAGQDAAYSFTAKQLDVYGIYELQVLEDVLRMDITMASYEPTLMAVCDQIKSKIYWDRSRWDVNPERFLRAFYAALRSHLERKMLFGKRREDKYSQG